MLLLSQVILTTCLWTYTSGDIQLTQALTSITKRRGTTAFLECQIKGILKKNSYTHWYRQKRDQTLKRILCISSDGDVIHEPGVSEERYEARKHHSNLLVSLRIHGVEEADAGLYFCASWISSGWIKIFAEGTQLIVIPGDRSYGSEFYPKPTIFRPSAAEINLHKAGTHLCLLEKFFPDVIKVYWKEKDGDTILESQQGNTMKVGDSYMKFSWLTVSEESMHKEHRCIVKHEHNKVDQEILFPAIKKEAAVINHKIEVNLEDKSDIFQLQLINTSAFYTYLLLLLKSLVYLAVISVCLVRRTAVCDHGKSS
nr:TCR gamma alternate reading frame protein isoform X1 [Pipistrellus kuhlii]XP_036285680.1 TCR gamma alternate reading frame protein isoform X2 [Pipistrellus kuhlii]